MRETLARAFPGHLDQAQLGESVYGYARAISGERFPEFGEDGVLVFLAVHVDEVNNDDAAEIAQSQLPRDGLGSFEIGFENSVIETSPRHKCTGIYIDGDQRLGLVDNDVSTGFQIYAAFQTTFDFILDAEQVKQRSLAPILFENRQRLPGVTLRKIMHARVRLS